MLAFLAFPLPVYFFRAPKTLAQERAEDGSRVPPEPPVPPRLAYLVRTNPGSCMHCHGSFFPVHQPS